MKKTTAAVVLSLCLLSSLSAQQIKEMQFKNQAITDILLALAQMTGKSIVPDETVSGTASYFFSATDFETALQIFLNTYKMYYWKEGNIYYVSKIRAQWNKDAGTATLDAQDVEPRLIVSALSKAMGKTVLFDTLPRDTLTIHADGTKPDKLLGMLMARFPDYQVTSTADFYYIKNTAAAAAAVAAAAAPTTIAPIRPGVLIAKNGAMYSIGADKVNLKAALIDLFQKQGVEFSLFLRTDVIMENIRFTNKTFDEMLCLLMEQGSADFSVENGVYYVYDIQRTDVMKKFKTIKSIPLAYVSVQDLTTLFPQDVATQNLFRMDRNTNTVILSGSPQEIGPIEDFLKAIDRPMEQKNYYRYDLNYMKTNELLSLLPTQFQGVKPIIVPQSNSVVLLLTADNKRAFDEFLGKVDKKQAGAPVHLRYMSADALLKNLPPSVAKEDVVATGDSTMVLFTGTEEKRRQFQRELDVLDRPIPQIRYELLVLEYQIGDDFAYDINTNANPSGAAPTGYTVLGTIGQLLKLNFNVVTTFGYLFAVDLNAKLSQNKANVMADTTVNGLSGQDIKFQNTFTSRYRDFERDPTTGLLQPSGVTREVTSGLIINMNGWVSGDGMITMKISSTISKQGADTSSTGGNLPTTSEKVVTTNIRTSSGTPVVISGLLQQEKTWTADKVPFLGDIPILGLLFQGQHQTITDTELTIYIVPHVEYPELRESEAGLKMERLYQSLVKGQ